VSSIPEPVRSIVESSYGHGIADLFLYAVPLGVVALIAVLFLQEVPLGRRSGVEQLLDSDTAADVAEAGTPGAQQAAGAQAESEAEAAQAAAPADAPAGTRA
jgi:hypothetical protein